MKKKVKKKGKKGEMSYEDIYKKVHKFMFPKGMKCGNEIAKLLRKKDNIVIPLYKSAIVITPKDGRARVDTYHDPHWMGEEITKKTLKRYHCNSLLFAGQRSGVGIFSIDEFDGELSRIHVPDVFDKIKKLVLRENE